MHSIAFTISAICLISAINCDELKAPPTDKDGKPVDFDSVMNTMDSNPGIMMAMSLLGIDDCFVSNTLQVDSKIIVHKTHAGLYVEHVP